MSHNSAVGQPHCDMERAANHIEGKRIPVSSGEKKVMGIGWELGFESRFSESESDLSRRFQTAFLPTKEKSDHDLIKPTDDRCGRSEASLSDRDEVLCVSKTAFFADARSRIADEYDPQSTVEISKLNYSLRAMVS